MINSLNIHACKGVFDIGEYNTKTERFVCAQGKEGYNLDEHERAKLIWCGAKDPVGFPAKDA
jgi:hypothetical protein